MKSITQLKEEIEELENKIGEPFQEEYEKLVSSKAILNQTKEIIKIIEDIKETWAETEVTQYSKGYSNGVHFVCDKLIKKLQGEE